MADHSQAGLIKSGLKAMLLAALIALGLGVAAWLGWIDISEAQVKPIQAQGSSPYCLFAVTANLYDGDMWALEAEYHRRKLPTTDGRIPLARPIIDLAGALGHPMVIAARWDTATVEATVQRQPVAVTGQGHAVVLTGWKRGKITYLDSLHAGRTLTMTDQAFWAWWDGWAWYLEESAND